MTSYDDFTFKIRMCGHIKSPIAMQRMYYSRLASLTVYCSVYRVQPSYELHFLLKQKYVSNNINGYVPCTIEPNEPDEFFKEGG
jgi:hypothetical protein